MSLEKELKEFLNSFHGTKLIRPDYTTNSKSYYDYLEKVTAVLMFMSKKIDEYDGILTSELQNIKDTLDDYLEKWDENLEKFDESVLVLLQEWMDDGTFEHIINHEIFQNKLDTSIFEQFELSVNQQLQHIEERTQVTPDDFEGSDFEKVQAAVNHALINTVAIVFTRIYNITGHTLIVDKSLGISGRFPLRLIGLGGGLRKDDDGYIFTAPVKNTGDIYLESLHIRSVSGAGTVLFDGNKLIRTYTSNCSYHNLDGYIQSDEFIQSTRMLGDHVVGGLGNFFDFIGAYDLRIGNNLIEWRENFLHQHTDISKTHRSLYNVSIQNNVIEGLTGYGFHFGETQSLVIDSNYFEKNGGGDIRWTQEVNNSLVFDGVTITNNRGFDDPEKHPLIVLPSRVFGFKTSNNRKLNNICIDASSTYVSSGGGVLYSENDTARILDPNNVILTGNYSQSIKRYESIDSVVTTHSRITRMMTRKNQTLTSTSPTKITFEFPQAVNIDDIISVQIVSDGITVRKIYRNSTNRKLLEVTVSKDSDTPTTINTNFFVTVLKMDFSTADRA